MSIASKSPEIRNSTDIGYPNCSDYQQFWRELIPLSLFDKLKRALPTRLHLKNVHNLPDGDIEVTYMCMILRHESDLVSTEELDTEISLMLNFIAECKSWNVEEAVEITTTNAKRFFSANTNV